MKEYTWKNKRYTLISCVCFLIIWQAAALLINNDIYIPRLDYILKSMINIIKDDKFVLIIVSTFLRAGVSYVLAFFLAIILGVLSVVYPLFKYIMQPLNSFIRTIPTLVLIVLALVWFDKDMAPFIVGFAIVFPILYEGIRNSIIQIDKKIIDMAKIYEVSLSDKILKIYLPNIKFHLMNIFISTFSLTFKVVIAGEVHGQPKYGIGSMVQLEKVNFNTSGIFAWIIIIVIISMFFEIINLLLKKKIYRWKR